MSSVMEEFAVGVCEDFDMTAGWPGFRDQACLVVYYETALKLVKEVPFRQQSVQIAVEEFLTMRIRESREKLLAIPLGKIRERLSKLKED